MGNRIFTQPKVSHPMLFINFKEGKGNLYDEEIWQLIP